MTGGGRICLQKIWKIFSLGGNLIGENLPLNNEPRRESCCKGQRKRGRSAINIMLMKEYIINFAKWSLGKCFKEIFKFAMKKMGSPDVCIDAHLNKAVWAKGDRNVSCCIHFCLSRKHNDDGSPSEKLDMLVTHVPVTSYKGLQTVNVDQNYTVNDF
ncbi:large ribosomal subunit protein eL31-like [Chiloscyllium punctatum]|uniref:large ribosomal subunit protein eL31-like n=1 Tax=Chiloscyllium punctatum TaxID=137246 RepID=UPI003B63D339